MNPEEIARARAEFEAMPLFSIAMAEVQGLDPSLCHWCYESKPVRYIPEETAPSCFDCYCEG